MTPQLTAPAQRRARPQAIRHETLSVQVANFLRDTIITGKFKEGQRLTESELASLTGASYTPIREALLTLEAEGLVTIVPHRGAWVSGTTEDELTELYAIRGSLEALAGKSAAAFITDDDIRGLEALGDDMERLPHDEKGHELAFRLAHEFHELYLTRSRFPHLLRILKGLSSQLRRYSFYSIRQNPKRLREIAGEHRHIVAAFRRRDPVVVEAAIRDHILRGGEEALRAFAIQHEGATRKGSQRLVG